jgi:hypothetical protein
MTPHQQAYIEGFVKRANQHGFTNNEAVELLKQSGFLGDIVNAGKNAINSATTSYNNYVDSKNKPTPESRAADERARNNYNAQMKRQPVTPAAPQK